MPLFLFIISSRFRTNQKCHHKFVEQGPINLSDFCHDFLNDYKEEGEICPKMQAEGAKLLHDSVLKSSP